LQREGRKLLELAGRFEDRYDELSDRRSTPVRLTEICLGLPEATRQDGGRHASFLVRKKTFAYFLDNHHGDGIVAACCKVALGENADLAVATPSRFYLPAYKRLGRVTSRWRRDRLERSDRAGRRQLPDRGSQEAGRVRAVDGLP
jgi:hypothetical protein